MINSVEKRAEGRVQPERLFRLVSPGDTIEVKRYKNGSASFHARPVGTDIGEVRLFGEHKANDLDKPDIVCTTIREGRLVEDTQENLEEKQGQFHIGVELPHDNPFWPNRALFCRLEIDGIDESFEAELASFKDERDPTTPPHAFTSSWRGIDPTNTKQYEIYASPNDTDLLSRFGFSLYTKPGVKPTLF